MKQLQQFFMMITLAIIIAGCGNTSTTNEEISIMLTITDHTSQTTISEDEITLQAGTTLLSVLEDNYNVEVTDEGFLTAIEEYEQDPGVNMYWTYEVNGEMVNEGIANYQVEDEDHITFDLQVIE